MSGIFKSVSIEAAMSKQVVDKTTHQLFQVESLVKGFVANISACADI
jgi:hypothetical protein